MFSFSPYSQNQVILLDTLDQEITKFKDCNSLLDLNSLVCMQLCAMVSHIFAIMSVMMESDVCVSSQRQRFIIPNW